MNSLAEVLPRAVPFAQFAFEAFRVTEQGNTVPLDIDGATSLATIVETAKVHCFHKDHLLIRETDRTWDRVPKRLGGGVRVQLHLYAIKRKSTPRYVHRDHVRERVHDLYAAPVCVIDAAAMRFTISEGE